MPNPHPNFQTFLRPWIKYVLDRLTFLSVKTGQIWSNRIILAWRRGIQPKIINDPFSDFFLVLLNCHVLVFSIKISYFEVPYYDYWQSRHVYYANNYMWVHHKQLQSIYFLFQQLCFFDSQLLLMYRKSFSRNQLINIDWIIPNTIYDSF